ncbi:DUF6624 domain-containing protein [Caulobacter vibrioides]|uniref:DUF6624 domain-containing protein n=1 Tax=Caulobacter vibrioides TaxID=155892 RepID=UPI000BB4D7F0|nr:hypothetical protein CA608_18060 [Caulobacter vibrioides]PLR10840.1 hypothetical protein CVUC_12215 [Caulobacter vibrioides]
MTFGAGLAVFAFALASASPPALPLAALRADPSVARTFDYWSLRAGRTPAELRALAGAIAADAKTKGCRTEAEFEIVLGLESAASAPSPESWRADRDAAARLERESEALRAKALAGEKVGDQYINRNVQTFVEQAQAARTPRARAVIQRVAVDQALLSIDAPGDRTPGVEQRIALRAEHSYCVLTRDNAEWLRAQIKSDGWFTLSAEGAEADRAAWLMVQHSDHDPAFQREALALLTRLKDQNETSKRNYAYLYDRLAANEGRNQLYATQGRCRAGQREPHPAVDDPAGLAARRAEMGLESLEAYYARWGPCPKD